MAKNNVEKMEVEQPENTPGFFQKLFYWVIIPLVFCIAVVLIISIFTNKNVFEYVDKLPFVSSNDEKELVESAASSDKKLVEVQAELKEKEVEITQIQSQFDSATEENQTLQTEIERLNYEIEKLQLAQEESTKEFSEILSTFEKMSAKKAAPIIVKMDEAEAVRLLSSMKPNTLTAIFEKMSAEDAAKYTQLLTE